MAHYIFNAGEREGALAFLRAGRWEVARGERHRDALAAGDLALVYLGAPEHRFVGRAELVSPVRGDEVALAGVEEWDPPVPMADVLARLPATARADFDAGVVEITAHEYATVLAVAAG